MDGGLQPDAELRHDIDSAIELDQLLLHYQPVVDLRSGELLGFEALVQWHHPTRGLLGPSELLPLVEDTDAVVRIDVWAIDQACRELARRGTAVDGPWISVDVAPRHLAADLVTVVTAALERHGVPPGALMLELTDVAVTAGRAGTDDASAVLRDLRALGVLLAIDHFGTGTASLRHLDELPIDAVKIDPGLASGGARASDSLLEGIVGLARTLGLTPIATGIGARSDLARLDGLGALAGQGALLGVPMTAEEAEAFERTLPLAV